MLTYNSYENHIPELVLNLSGNIYLENKPKLNIRFEIDYNSMTEEELNKVIKDMKPQFNEASACISYNEDNKFKMENLTYIPIEENGIKKYKTIKTENNSINFKMIKKNIVVLKDNIEVLKTDIDHTKTVEFNLSDGVYTFKCNVYNIYDEFVCSDDIKVTLITNYFSMNKPATPFSIPFSEEEGNFEIRLNALSKRLYSFVITDLISKNDNIFDFSYYNTNDDSKTTQGKVGAELHLLNDKQIEEIVANPAQEQLIKPRFIFDIKEVFTTTHSKDDIGVVRFPTIREKLRDTYMPYYDLKCDVSQSYTLDFDKTDDLLVTDKFNKYPLFYKFLIDEPYDYFKIKDEKGNEVTDYIMETINKDIKLIYFNPLRNKKYYYTLDDNFYYNIEYKRAIDSYRMTFYTGSVEMDSPHYIADLILKGPEGTYDVEIQFSDYNKKTFKMKAIDREFKFLEDERIKINKEILSMKVLTDKDMEEFKFISVLCNFKNNRNSYSFFKKDYRDFVYIAKSVGDIKLEDIPNSQLPKMNINKKYILKDNILEEVNNGPIYLEPIRKQDIVFTDIEEWINEYDIGETMTLKTNGVDNFFEQNIIDNSMEIIDEAK